MRRRFIQTACILLGCVMVFTLLPATAHASEVKGKYPSRPGTILVTPDKYKGLIPTGHAAIVEDDKHIIESLASGVQRSDNDWEKWRSRIYGLKVKKTTKKQDRKALAYCIKQIGKKYNFNYYNVKTRKKFYCSHLVWAAFKDKLRVDMNTKAFGKAVHPLELVDSKETSVIYTFSRR